MHFIERITEEFIVIVNESFIANCIEECIEHFIEKFIEIPLKI